MSLDFFGSHYGERKHPWQRRRVASWFDRLFDWRIAARMAGVRETARATPPRSVLVASVLVPERAAHLQGLFTEFQACRHRVDICAAEMGDRGKYENINLALEKIDLSIYDYLIVTDDDITLAPGFMDHFIAVVERLDLKIAQPAHRCHSYASFTFNQRQWGVLGRVTRYVEDGPMTLFHRDAYAHVLPFPALRWAWGTDLLWCAMAEREKMAIGIVDCTPIEHLRPVAGSYEVGPAIAEGRALLAAHGISPRREDLFSNETVLRAL